MKPFNQFRKDLSEMDRTMSGPGLVGAGLRGMIRLGSEPIQKVVRAVTSFSSKKDEIQDFVKRRKAGLENKKKVNKGIQNVRDPEADKRVADAAKDPDLEKIGRMENPNVVDFKKPNKPKK